MKVLWKESNFHSVYSDSSTGLFVNKDWAPVPLWKVFVSSIPVTLELCITLLFVGCFLTLLFHEVQPYRFLGVVGVCSFVGFWYVVVQSKFAVFGIVRGAVALLGTLYLITPVLASLASSVSDDTIAFVVIMLLLIHVVSYDYFQNEEAVEVEFRALFSTNTGLLSAIFLCSRMSEQIQVFCVIALSLSVFALIPLVLTRIRMTFPWFYCILGIVVFPVATFWFYFRFLKRNDPQYIPAFVWTFGLCLFVINVFSPILFYKMQTYKVMIHSSCVFPKSKLSLRLY